MQGIFTKGEKRKVIFIILPLITANIVLSLLLRRKHLLDLSAKEILQNEVAELQHEKERLGDKLDQIDEAIQRAEKDYRKNIEQYTKDSVERRNELASLEMEREQELQRNYDTLVAAKRELYKRDLQSIEDEIDNEFSLILQNYTDKCGVIEVEEQELLAALASRRKQYEDYIVPLQTLEKEQMEKLFYCLQVPEVEHADIHYLLNVVSPQVRNKDVIPKVVWSEYLQKPTQDLMKRIEAKDQPGIYKITNIKTSKCYVGKSTKVRQRLIDHVKGSLGITTISDQLIHHAMFEEGLWNWTMEIVCYCDKDELGEKEKFYIENYKAREYGYNIAAGG